ncbi:MAG: glycosyltransferase family 4 protein [Hyphomicrobiales bacterium]|nr:glycosyltransferase family 4 protein [Hyphomicrobiales bacterium]
MEKPSIAFYAPLKPPDHPIPSGDRRMAGNLYAALEKAGYNVFLASRYICYSKRWSEEYFNIRRQGAIEEAERLIKLWGQQKRKPDLWFSFHNYCKAPDWLGMHICNQLDIPLVLGKPCKTGQGPNGEWDKWRVEAQRCIAMAEANIVMTYNDKEYLESLVPKDKIFWIPPFLDINLLTNAQALESGTDADSLWSGGLKLFTPAMMRPGAKMESYKILSQALKLLDDRQWSLVIAGSGPGFDEVKAMFDWDTKNRVNLIGEVKPEEIFHLIDHADLLTWPGWREAYGMVYLEAASRGCPVAALNNTGVPLVVEHERSGLLATPPDVKSYSQILSRLLNNRHLVVSLAKGARDFFDNERSGGQTAGQLKQIIDPVLERPKPKVG